MIDLNDPVVARALFAAIDRRIEQYVGRQPQIRYGIVAAVDTPNRKVSVNLGGDTTASPGFTYGTAVPIVGSRVRVIVTSSGDRYVDDVL
jgi:hypothetical protein